MIHGIGVDTVNVNRFAHWCTYTPTKLARIFSAQEISYCLSNQHQSAQRFAVRFAAREALLKALHAAGCTVPLLTVCHAVTITKDTNGCPRIIIDWSRIPAKHLPDNYKALIAHISLSHTTTIATAFITLSTAPGCHGAQTMQPPFDQPTTSIVKNRYQT